MKKPLIVAILIAAFRLISGKRKAYVYVDIAYVKGQQIPVGTTLSVKETPTAANNSNHCIVIAA